jgi:anti-sigma factor RsiW
MNATSRCPDGWDPALLLAYLEEELTVAQREQLERHLGSCRECASELQALQAMDRLLKERTAAFHLDERELAGSINGEPRNLEQVEDHIARCHSCKEDVELLRAMQDAAQDSPDPALSVPPELARQLERLFGPPPEATPWCRVVQQWVGDILSPRMRMPVFALGTAAALVVGAVLVRPMWEAYRTLEVPSAPGTLKEQPIAVRGMPYVDAPEEQRAPARPAQTPAAPPPAASGYGVKGRIQELPALESQIDEKRLQAGKADQRAAPSDALHDMPVSSGAVARKNEVTDKTTPATALESEADRAVSSAEPAGGRAARSRDEGFGKDTADLSKKKVERRAKAAPAPPAAKPLEESGRQEAKASIPRSAPAKRPHKDPISIRIVDDKGSPIAQLRAQLPQEYADRYTLVDRESRQDAPAALETKEAEAPTKQSGVHASGLRKGITITVSPGTSGFDITARFRIDGSDADRATLRVDGVPQERLDQTIISLVALILAQDSAHERDR